MKRKISNESGDSFHMFLKFGTKDGLIWQPKSGETLSIDLFTPDSTAVEEMIVDGPLASASRVQEICRVYMSESTDGTAAKVWTESADVSWLQPSLFKGGFPCRCYSNE
jgi:hypothetical protein